MPPLYRIIEVAVYALLNFLPHMLLALYPFRDQFRFSKPVTGALIGVMTVVQILLGFNAAFEIESSGWLSIASTAIYAGFYFLSVKAHFGKTLFTLLMLSNIANLIVICAKCLEGLIFGQAIAMESYRWTNSVCMVIAHLVITLPLAFYFRRFYCDGINKKSGAAVWNYLWLIPATFYLFWFHHIYGSGQSSLELALQPAHALFLLVIDLGSFLIYHMVILMINAQDKSAKLEENNHQLAMQKLQYENLQDRINEARQAKHDIRHHITIMDSYLKNGELDELKKYLNSYQKSLPDDSAIVFCQNYAINALLLYFAQQAKNHRIDYDVVMAEVPKQVGIPDNTLTVVLGNLLENAVEACTAVNDRPRSININIKTAPDSMFIRISNTYNGELIRDGNGHYLSTKHAGRGVGLPSVRSIVKQYDGIYETDQMDGIFTTSIFLNIPKE